MLTEPRTRVTACEGCGGLGGYGRGDTAFDACDLCRGTGDRTRYECTAPLLGIECGERVVLVVSRSDTRDTTWGCINGHRWDVRAASGAYSWSRTDDRASIAVEAVAS